MMRWIMSRLVLVLWVLLAAGAVAQQPTAVVTGPKEAVAGDLVVLDASQSQGLGYLWLLTNSGKSFLPVDNGLRCVFASAEGGRYLFVLVVAGVNPNGGPAAAMATHELTLKSNTPPVDPKPPKPPDPIDPPAAVSAVILVETGELTADQAQVLNQLRNEPVAKLVKILDKDSQTSDGKPVKQVQDALKHLAGKPLPAVVAVSSAGSFGDVAELPTSLAATLELLTKWGIK